MDDAGLDLDAQLGKETLEQVLAASPKPRTKSSSRETCLLQEETLNRTKTGFQVCNVCADL